MSNILVTGGAGFIGANLVNHLINQGEDNVVVLDDLSGGFRENVHPNATLIIGSITDEKCVNDLFENYKFTYVYHLAAYAAEGLSHFIRRFNYNNNLVGSINLINASIVHEVSCFVFTSSIAVYGSIKPPMREVDVPHPEDPYGIAKYAVELDLKNAKEMFGLNYVVFRPHNVYGEFQNIGDKYRNVVGIFMNQILKGESLSIFGDGSQQRAFSYIGDMVPLIAESAKNEKCFGEVFNIGAETPTSVSELAEIVCDEMGEKSHPIQYHEARNEVKFAYSDHSKLESVFGNLPSTDLKHGIRNMAAWVAKNGSKKTSEFANIEIQKNLPPFWLGNKK
ncbi:MAG: UDP-glucose 4-epimerase [Sphingobacteriales bacterium]|jgi:UDP-glucose 4-epimerase